MRFLLIPLLLLATSLMACPGGCGQGPMMHKSCDNKMVNPRSTLGTVKYALHIMKLQDDPDIKMAIHSYKQSVGSLSRGMNTDAFKNGKFDKALYIQNSRKQRKLQAEIDLFETIYLVLNNEQKVKFHRLMAAHQHYMGMDNIVLNKSRCGMKPSCNANPDCGCQGKGTPDCKCDGNKDGACKCENCLMDNPEYKKMRQACKGKDDCGCQGKGTPDCKCDGGSDGLCKCKNCMRDNPACKGNGKGAMKCGPGKCGGGM